MRVTMANDLSVVHCTKEQTKTRREIGTHAPVMEAARWVTAAFMPEFADAHTPW